MYSSYHVHSNIQGLMLFSFHVDVFEETQALTVLHHWTPTSELESVGLVLASGALLMLQGELTTTLSQEMLHEVR